MVWRLLNCLNHTENITLLHYISVTVFIRHGKHYWTITVKTSLRHAHSRRYQRTFLKKIQGSAIFKWFLYTLWQEISSKLKEELLHYLPPTMKNCKMQWTFFKFCQKLILNHIAVAHLLRNKMLLPLKRERAEKCFAAIPCNRVTTFNFGDLHFAGCYDIRGIWDRKWHYS